MVEMGALQATPTAAGAAVLEPLAARRAMEARAEEEVLRLEELEEQPEMRESRDHSTLKDRARQALALEEISVATVLEEAVAEPMAQQVQAA